VIRPQPQCEVIVERIGREVGGKDRSRRRSVADQVRHLLRLFRLEEPAALYVAGRKTKIGGRIEQHPGSRSARGPGFSTGFTETDAIAGAPLHRGLKVWSKTSCGSSHLASVAVPADLAEQYQQAPHPLGGRFVKRRLVPT